MSTSDAPVRAPELAHGLRASGQLVETEEAAKALVARLARSARLALDTEGDGMFRYRTNLCTMQLAGAGEIAVVDTLAVPAPLFGALLGERGPEKIIHDAAFDARVLLAHGVQVGRVFDTAVAARFLGLPSTGLSSLLFRFFELHLPKHQQQADWGARPIDAEAMLYLENDVRYLSDLADALLAAVREKDIEAEVREECRHVLSEARKVEPQEPAWMRVKTAALQPPKERARLVELAEERERLARELDQPPARFLNSELLVHIARKAPTSVDAMAQLLGSRREHAARMFEALQRGDAHDDAPLDQLSRLSPPAPSPVELLRRKRRKACLLDFRDKQAKARGVDPQVVLPGHCINDMVGLPALTDDLLRGVSGFGECRVQRYGALLLQLAPHFGE